MSNFEWHTEEDGAEEALQPAGENGATPGRRHLVLFLLFVAVVLGGAAYWIYRAGEQHVAETTARVEADVRASHELVRRAGLDTDLELFQRFISSADPDWARAEEQMVMSGRWLDRSTVGLSWDRTLSATSGITLSADLLEAEVVSRESYRYVDGNGEEKAATLAQTRVYRLGPDRWLLAPPAEEFWGEEAVVERPRLRLTYPARDEALALRLATDLSDLIERACDELADLDCPANYRLSARFSRDPSLLQNGLAGTLPLWAEQPPALPAPSLIGIPVDEAGYRALYLGYARQSIATAIAELLDWRCCQPGLFFQVLLEQQREALGLGPAPPAPPTAIYNQMLQAQVDVDDASSLWAQVPAVGDSPALQSARVIVDFLRQRFPQLSLTQWQRELAAAGDYREWLAAVTEDAGGPALAMGWHSYLYAHAAGDDGSPSPEAPAEDVLLMCDLQEGRRTVMRFDPQTETFTRALEDARLGGGLAPAPIVPAGPDSAFIAGYDEGGLRILRWQAGKTQLIWESGDVEDKEVRFVGASPDGRQIVIEEIDGQRRLPTYRVAEVDACLDGGCNWRRSIYRPLWSPDGRYVINAVPQGNVLFLAETYSDLQPFWYMDVGTSPVWLDEETFAYVRQVDGELASVAIAAVDEREVQNLVDISELREQLPPGAIVAPNIGLARHPGDANALFLAVQTIRSQRPTATTIFLARRDTRQLFKLFSATNGDPTSLSISPAGRWLALESDEGLVLYDLVADRGSIYTEGAQPIAALWSPSGAWLFTGGDGRYYLIAPGSDGRDVPAGGLACDSAVWLGG